MKKIFKYSAILAVAALSIAACTKDNKDDNGGNTEPSETVKPVVSISADAAFTDGKATVTVTLDKANPDNATTVTLALDAASTLTASNVTVPASITVAKAAKSATGEVTFTAGDLAAGEYTAVIKATGADNNATIGSAATATIKATVTGSDTPTPGTSLSWDYVMDISSYKTNSEFHFSNPVKLSPGSLTLQWKFYPTEWNDYDKDVERDGETFHVWANRLGQISNSAEKGILLRFNDGHEKGSLRLNAAIFANDGKDYVQKDGKDYIWELNTWHTLSIVADGSTVSVYDNAEMVYSFEYTVPEVYAEWPVERFDISMTWDDGTRYDKGQAFRGYQAYTRLWSRALSTEEIAASLCNVDNAEGLELYWAYNLDEGTTVKNNGTAAGYDLDFTKALAGGQASYVKAEDIEGTWTPAGDVAPVCE